MGLADRVVQDLRSVLVRGELPAGAAVTEAWVCERFGVARPTAKNAIDRLVHEGVLEQQPNHPARVPRFTPEDIDDLYHARLVIERDAVIRLVNGRSIPVALRRSHELMTSADSLGEFVTADIEFHRALVTAARSPRLAAMHALVIGETELCMARVRSQDLLAIDDVIADHARLVDAIASGDGDRAVDLLERHIAWAKEAVIDSLGDN